MLRFVGYDYIDVRNNRQRSRPGRDMVMVGFMRSCEVTVSTTTSAARSRTHQVPREMPTLRHGPAAVKLATPNGSMAIAWRSTSAARRPA